MGLFENFTSQLKKETTERKPPSQYAMDFMGAFNGADLKKSA